MKENLHDGNTDQEHSLPFCPVQWYDGEEGLEEGCVEQCEVENH